MQDLIYKVIRLDENENELNTVAVIVVKYKDNDGITFKAICQDEDYEGTALSTVCDQCRIKYGNCLKFVAASVTEGTITEEE